MRTIVALALFVSGCCCNFDPSSKGSPSPASEGKTVAASAQVMNVSLAKLLGDYKANEVRADGTYKGKTIQVSGTVDDVKKDLMGDAYVTVGSGAAFEIPQVQCMGGATEEAAFSKLNKGQKVTVQGKVDGLMMNVLLSDCVVK